LGHELDETSHDKTERARQEWRLTLHMKKRGEM